MDVRPSIEKIRELKQQNHRVEECNKLLVQQVDALVEALEKASEYLSGNEYSLAVDLVEEIEQALAQVKGSGKQRIVKNDLYSEDSDDLPEITEWK